MCVIYTLRRGLFYHLRFSRGFVSAYLTGINYLPEPNQTIEILNPVDKTKSNRLNLYCRRGNQSIEIFNPVEKTMPQTVLNDNRMFKVLSNNKLIAIQFRIGCRLSCFGQY